MRASSLRHVCLTDQLLQKGTRPLGTTVSSRSLAHGVSTVVDVGRCEHTMSHWGAELETPGALAGLAALPNRHQMWDIVVLLCLHDSPLGASGDLERGVLPGPVVQLWLKVRNLGSGTGEPCVTSSVYSCAGTAAS